MEIIKNGKTIYMTASGQNVSDAVKEIITLAKKEVFDDIDKLLFDKHFHKEIYVRWKISASEYSELKRRHIK